MNFDTSIKKTSWILCLMLTLSMFLSVNVYSTPIESGAWWDKSIKEAQEHGFHLLKIDEFLKDSFNNSNTLIVDVRPGYEFNMGHIPNAVSFEFSLEDKSSLKEEKAKKFKLLLGFDQHLQIVIYCRSYA